MSKLRKRSFVTAEDDSTDSRKKSEPLIQNFKSFKSGTEWTSESSGSQLMGNDSREQTAESETPFIRRWTSRSTPRSSSSPRSSRSPLTLWLFNSTNFARISESSSRLTVLEDKLSKRLDRSRFGEKRSITAFIILPPLRYCFGAELFRNRQRIENLVHNLLRQCSMRRIERGSSGG